MMSEPSTERKPERLSEPSIGRNPKLKSEPMNWRKLAGPSVLLLLLGGCAPVMQRPFNLQNIKIDCGRAYDIRTGRYWFIRIFQPPHGIDVWRDEKGDLQVRPRESSTSAALEDLQGIGGHVPVPKMLAKPPAACE